jgi:DNA-binding CsgD family transcriptional regulator
VILTNYALDEYVFAALRAGAAGFLVKDIEPDDLLRGVHVVARGDALLAPAVTRSLVEQFITTPPRPATPKVLETLTRREREVTVLVAAGLSNEEIAGHLTISHLTAKTHVSRAKTKIGVPSTDWRRRPAGASNLSTPTNSRLRPRGREFKPTRNHSPSPILSAATVQANGTPQGAPTSGANPNADRSSVAGSLAVVHV